MVNLACNFICFNFKAFFLLETTIIFVVFKEEKFENFNLLTSYNDNGCMGEKLCVCIK